MPTSWTCRKPRRPWAGIAQPALALSMLASCVGDGEDPGAEPVPASPFDPANGDGDTSTSGTSTGLDETGATDTESAGDDVVRFEDLAGVYIEEPVLFTHTLTPQLWTIDFGESWDEDAILAIEAVEDQERWVAGQDAMGRYSRYDWDFDEEGRLRYCTAVFDVDTLELAIAAPPSDRDDFDGLGCGQAFPWSALIRAPPPAGPRPSETARRSDEMRSSGPRPGTLRRVEGRGRRETEPQPATGGCDKTRSGPRS